MSTTTLTFAITQITGGYIVPMVVLIIAVSWISGIAIKAMKSTDLV